MTSGGGAGGAVDQAYVEVELRDNTGQSLRDLEQNVGNATDNAGRAGGSRLSEGLKGAFSAGVGGLATLAAGAAAAAATAVAGAVVAGAKGALDIAAQANQGLLDFQAQLGASTAEAQKYGEQAKEVFGANWGESLTDAQGMLIEVRKQMKGLADEELVSATNNAAALADTFGTEVGEQASAAESLMKNFGLTSQQAFDFLAKGYQSGLDSSGDFLDTIGEYSTQFKNGGATAEQFFSLLETGIQGGVLGTDKAADSFKEFTVRIQDGSKTTSDGLKALGIDANKLSRDMANGTVTSADAYQLVIGKLRETKDANTQMQAGVALLGTQFEDLGKSGALALDMTKTKLSDMAGSTDAVQQRYNNLGQLMQGVWRQTLLQLEPVGQQLLSLANDAMPYVKQAIQQLGPIVTNVVNALVSGMTQAKGSFNSVAPVVQQAFGVVKGIIGALAPYIVTVFNGIKPVVQALGPMFSAAFTLIGQIWNQVLKPALAAMHPFFQASFGAISATVRGAMQIVTGILQTVSAFMRGDVSGAARALNGAFDKAAAGIGQAMREGAAVVMKALGGLPAQVTQLAGQIIAGLVIGIRNGVGQIGQAARDMASGFLENVRKTFDMRSPSRVMFTLGQFTSQGFVNGVASKDSDVKKAAQNSASQFLQAFKDLNLERIAGKVDLASYTKTLTDAATALRAKLGTVKEGTPAYSAYLSALTKVEKELDALRGKTAAAQEATQRANDELRKGADQIAAAEATDRQARALNNATTAQLQAALASAKAKGDAERWNAVRAEMREREEAVAAATRKSSDAQQQAARQLSDNRAQINATEAAERYTRALDNATGAQLRNALATARAKGDVEKYNAIRAELKDREEAVAAATQKTRDAQAAAARQLADNRGQIAANEASEKYRVILDNATDAQLKNALQVARAKGEVEKYNLIRAEQKEREDEVTAATDKARDAARQHAEQVAANRKAIEDGLKFDEWVQGLTNYSDAQLQAARATALSTGDSRQFNAVLAEQKTRADEATAAIEALFAAEMEANAARYANTQAATASAFQQSFGTGDEGLIRSLAATTGLTIAQVRADVEGALADAKRFAADTAAIIERVYADALTHRRKVADEQRKADEEAAAAMIRASNDSAEQIAQDSRDRQALIDDESITVNYLVGLIDELLALGIDPRTNGFLTWLDELAEGSGRAAAAAAEVRAGFEGILAAATPTVRQRITDTLTPSDARPTRAAPEVITPSAARGTREAPMTADRARGDLGMSPDQQKWIAETQAKEYAAAATAAYAAELRKLTPAQLESARASALASGEETKHALILTEVERRAKAHATATELIAATSDQVRAALGKGEQPWAKQIDALLKSKGQSKELDAQIDELVASMQDLQAQAARQEGFDKLKNTIGQVGQVVGQVFALFGADAEIQQGISQLTAGIQDGVTAFAKFASGDILGGIQSALSGILNIGNAIENLSPALKAWKKGLLEVAAIEKEMVGAKSYGNINNPYYDTLMKDAAERERAGGSKWYQRLGWAIFGGAPQYMSEEAARFMAKTASIFGEVAESVVSGMDGALMNAFSSGDWTGTEEAMSKSLDQLVARMALQAILAASKLEARIKAYAEARANALKDGVIDPGEQAQLDLLIADIKAEQKRIADEWRATAETLPGYGADAKPKDDTTAPTPAPPEITPKDISTNRQVRVDLPDVAASINFDVLQTLANVVEAMGPRIEAGGASMVEGGGRLLAAVDRLERMLTNMEMRPSGWYR